MHAVRLEKNDSLDGRAPTAHTLRFRFNNYGGVDGFDFATHCAPFLAFGFASDGHVVPTGHISIGAAAATPLVIPFVIARTAGAVRRVGPRVGWLPVTGIHPTGPYTGGPPELEFS